MEKYLANGQAVKLIKVINGGYLFQNLWNDPDYNDEYTDESVTYFTDTLFDSPPVEKYHKEVLELQNQIKRLQKERDEIQQLKHKEKSLLAEIKNRDFIQCLVDYMNGNFEWLLRLDTMEICEKDKVYISPNIKLTNKEKKGYELFIMRSADYDSWDDRPIMVFKTFEDDQKFAKQALIDRLVFATEKQQYKWSSSNIKDWFNDIHHSVKLNEDKDILEIYARKYDETKLREDAEKKLKIQQEIEEKQKLLEKIS
jgi:hypothetical protein